MFVNKNQCQSREKKGLALKCAKIVSVMDEEPGIVELWAADWWFRHSFNSSLSKPFLDFSLLNLFFACSLIYKSLFSNQPGALVGRLKILAKKCSKDFTIYHNTILRLVQKRGVRLFLLKYVIRTQNSTIERQN